MYLKRCGLERIKISNRIKRLAFQIEQLPISIDKFADIGTDHGYLPYVLFENQVIKSSILCDVNKGPLQNAQQTFKGLNYSTEFRLGSGLEPLNPAEVDAIAIAGMGGGLTIDLLDHDLEKTLSYPFFLLQPMTEQDRLRKWLLDHKFVILWDYFFTDMDKQYEVVVAYNPNSAIHSQKQFAIHSTEGNRFLNPTSDLEFGYSINLKEENGYRAFLAFKKNKYKAVISKISIESHREVYTSTQNKLEMIEKIEKALDESVKKEKGL